MTLVFMSVDYRLVDYVYILVLCACYVIINSIKDCIYSATIAFARACTSIGNITMRIFKTYTIMYKYHPVADKYRFYLERSVFMHMYV